MLTNEFSIPRHLAEGLKLLRNVIQLAIVFIIFFPLFLLLVIEEVLFGWVKGLGVLREVALGSCDSLRHLAWAPSDNRVVFPDIPHLLSLFLQLLFLCLLLGESLHPALLEGLGVLGNLQTLPLRHNKAALWCVSIVEGMDPVCVSEINLQVLGIGVN